MLADSEAPHATDATHGAGDGPLIAREVVTLEDGARVKLRAIRPSDAEGLRAAFHRLSPESRYRRFLSGEADLSDAKLAYLTNVDGVDHVALVALVESFDLKEERIVGVGRWVRLQGEAEHDVAECAVTVLDELQNRGLGKVISERLRRAARASGVRKFRAEVLVSNAPMRHILTEVGALVKEETDDTIVFDVDLDDPRAEGDKGSMNRLLSAAASSVLVFMRR